MANLAIKGHVTRGKEVIEILKILGGVNKFNLEGNTEYWYVLEGQVIRYFEILFEGYRYRQRLFCVEDANHIRYPFELMKKPYSKFIVLDNLI